MNRSTGKWERERESAQEPWDDFRTGERVAILCRHGKTPPKECESKQKGSKKKLGKD